MLLILLSVASAVGIGLLLEPLFNDNDSSENNKIQKILNRIRRIQLWYKTQALQQMQ